MRSLKTHGDVSKYIPNSSIEDYNHELKSIMVNKGRIHRELSYFYVFFKFDQNQTKI